MIYIYIYIYIIHANTHVHGVRLANKEGAWQICWTSSRVSAWAPKNKTIKSANMIVQWMKYSNHSCRTHGNQLKSWSKEISSEPHNLEIILKHDSVFQLTKQAFCSRPGLAELPHIWPGWGAPIIQVITVNHFSIETHGDDWGSPEEASYLKVVEAELCPCWHREPPKNGDGLEDVDLS